jgi:hypothetical protein
MISLAERIKGPAAQDLFKRWFDAAPIYSGGVLANRLGWQVLRTVAKRGAISVRRWRSRTPRSAFADALDRDGIVIIPNFLPGEQYAQLLRAIDAYSSDRLRDIGDENGARIGYVSGPVVTERPGDAGDTVNAILGNDPLIISLARHVIGRRVRGPLRLIYQHLWLRDGDVDTTDREQVLHADKAFPCVKAIYSLDGISEQSSPFVYCPGTQRLTRQRLRYEHVMGVREALLRGGRNPDRYRGVDVELVRSRNAMGVEMRRNLGAVERAIVCPPNSLIVTNNAGFHRRGQLTPGSARRTLWIIFYPYQRPWYGKLAFWMAKSVIDTDGVSRQLSPRHRQNFDPTP